MVNIIVENVLGEKKQYEAVEGWSLMEILKDYGLPVKAECGGACCCATCHVYINSEWFDKLPPFTSEEEDMLDMAIDVRETSRLSCQIIIDKNLDGLSLKIAKQE